jgi:hypothetical protein
MTQIPRSNSQNLVNESQMVEQALHCLEQADTFTAIEYLNQQPEPLVVTAAYNDLVKDLYWEKRNISQVVAICRAGIQYCSDQAEKVAASNRKMAYSLRSDAKQLAYNLASYTWPGWNEQQIELEPLQIAAGLDAARFNLRLALELDKGDLALSRAYWMLAGHLLAANAVAGAEAGYRRAANYAERAGEKVDHLLALAFADLVRWILEPQDNSHRLTFEKSRESLATLEDGPAYQEQVDGAYKVFFQRTVISNKS